MAITGPPLVRTKVSSNSKSNASVGLGQLPCGPTPPQPRETAIAQRVGEEVSEQWATERTAETSSEHLRDAAHGKAASIETP